MTDKLDPHNRYEQWLAVRREVGPPADLADQIMNQVAEFECQRRSMWWLRLVEQIERSRTARWAVCGGALAIGVLPFLLFVHVSSF